MSNATSKAQSYTVPWGDDKIYRDLAATVTTYYAGQMIAMNGSGYAVKCTDTAGLRFDGLMCNSPRIEVETGDAAGDKKIEVEKPWLMGLKTNFTPAITDIGVKVYCVDDQTVGKTSSNSILVGIIEAVPNPGTANSIVVVRPYWTSTNGVVGFDGETLTFTGSTGVNEIIMPDNLADALSITQGSSEYVVFNTTDTTGEEIVIKKRMDLLDSVNLALGTGRDCYFVFDGTNLNLTTALDDQVFKIGNGTNSFDLQIFGNLAADYMLWDASVSRLQGQGNATIKPNTIADPGDGNAVSNLVTGYCPLVSAGAETRTLAAPAYDGQEVTLAMKTDNGNVVVTVASTIDETGNNTITFSNVGEFIKLIGVTSGSTPLWRTIAKDLAVATSTV